MKIQELRLDIIGQINVYFKKEMRLDERSLQILEYSPRCYDGWMDSADILSASLEYIPSVADLFIRAGIPDQTMSDLISKLNKIVTFRQNTEVEPDIKGTLWHVFPRGPAPDDLSRAYRKIRRKGSISALDLVIGELEGNLEGFDGSDFIQTELTANLLESVNLNGTYWDDENAQYISNLSDRVRFLAKVDRSIGNQQFILYWDDTQYRIRPFGTTGIYQFSDEPLKDGSLWIARGDVIQPIRRFRDEAFDELECLINRNSTEKEFQDFFERNPEFLLALR